MLLKTECYRKALRRLLEFKAATGDIQDLAERLLGFDAAAIRLHDLSFIEEQLRGTDTALQQQRSSDPGILQYLNRVKDTDVRKIAGEGNLWGLGWRTDGRRRRQAVRTAGPADGFEATRNVDAWIEILGFQQPIVCSFEVLALDVETSQRQALARRFIKILVTGSDFAQPLAQRNRPWRPFQCRA